MHYNDREQQSVEVHSCRSVWSGTSVRHLKEYRQTVAEGAGIALAPTDEPVRSIVLYQALVRAVELYVDGRMFQGDATTLSKGGWMFKVREEERVRAIAGASVLAERLMCAPDSTQTAESGLC